jgi:hypothetical protein
MNLKSLIVKILSKKYNSWKEFYSAKSKWINIILSSPLGRFLSISANQKEKRIFLYPSILRPLKFLKKEDRFWSKVNGPVEYPIKGPYFKKLGEERLSQILSLLKKLNINFEDVIMDIGCAGGYHIRQLENKGWNNLIGVEPNQAYKFLEEKSKNIKVYNEYFGKGNHLNEKPLLCYFDGSIDRIPYANDLSAIKILNPKYVIIITGTFVENHQRDWNMEFTKMGYYCSHKETWYTQEDGSLSKIYNTDQKKLECINSHYIFSKISEPPYTLSIEIEDWTVSKK